MSPAPGDGESGRAHPSTPGPPAGPSDPGLAGERTSLAWARMGLALLSLPSALLAYAVGRSLLAVLAAALAAALGLGLLVTSLIRQRAAPGMVETRTSHLAPRQVALTAACVLLLNLSAMALVVA